MINVFPAQVTLKYLTSQVMEGVSHPHFLNVFLEHVTSVMYIPNYFLLPYVHC